MSSAVDPLLVLVLMLNFHLLGTSRLRAAIATSATQGAIVGTLTLAVRDKMGFWAVILALAAVSIKGLLIPKLLHRALREAAIRREIEPFVSFNVSLVLGAAATGAAILFANRLPLVAESRDPLLVPASIATVLTGFLLLTTRRKAITQVVGYLTLENGVFVMGLTLHRLVPFLVELGVLLDLLVAVFVIGIVINRINREFASLDVAQLDTLRE